MKKLLCFVGGIVSVVLFIPIMENVAQICEAYSSKLITDMGIGIAKNQKEIADVQESCEPQQTHAIGFTAEGYGDEYEEDDE